MSMDISRNHMVQQQIRPQQVTDPKVLETLSQVPREDFVPAEYQSLAFAETFIPLSHGQSMLTPALEGQLLQALDLKSTDKILEVGTGSGYFTALLSKLGKHVYSVDCFEDFLEEANEKFRQHHLYNITLAHGKAENGWPNHAPYDAMILTGSLPSIPKNITEQLNIGGRLVLIIGSGDLMKALLIKKTGLKTTQEKVLFETHIPRLLDIKEPRVFNF